MSFAKNRLIKNTCFSLGYVTFANRNVFLANLRVAAVVSAAAGTK